ncbi:acyl-CoA dehydrogenase [Cryobacterium sp. TMT1-3]|uniref:Acyl-CoA dehydrogenase n=1 Tax=Cryobacterium luteum TaxID=1424661 RepID=A0A1H8G673_9MICO|nr:MULTISPECIES: acyl-CoA dehydrogenase family protein [Cryobacterium]TFB93870.1 acyl-CoA dehydrogenase [Cryobacterium luteum]TFC30001.1 acyl-CoA dehydrogenase [Cryobacterium sp. TMT1-3]SEN39254.1 glutaryl-CoA dehydrogenase [Cryobacterium luteum]
MSIVVDNTPVENRAADAPAPEFFTGPTADFFSYQDLLTPEEQQLVATAREVFERDVRPVVAEHWNNATFPFEIIPVLTALNLVDLCARGDNFLLHGFMTVELSRVDASISTFVGVHSGLFAAAIAQLGTDDQRERYLADAVSLRKIGAFALTEPEHGSDVSRNMETTASRSGDSWILNGVKRWIGSGTFAANVLVWARDTADDQIKGFIVSSALAGFTAEKIENKIALRIVQNATITLDNVVVAERDRLPGATSFRDTNRLLTNSRVWVGWQTVGLQFAAYDYALRYALERQQFGKPIASFQLVQEKLVRILENATSSLGTMVRIAQLQQAGTLRPEHAAMAKASSSARMRESVALGRSVLGGNGISTDYGMARVFADAEALYTYEGSYEINTLVVGRAITGISAFQ